MTATDPRPALAAMPAESLAPAAAALAGACAEDMSAGPPPVCPSLRLRPSRSPGPAMTAARTNTTSTTGSMSAARRRRRSGTGSPGRNAARPQTWPQGKPQPEVEAGGKAGAVRVERTGPEHPPLPLGGRGRGRASPRDGALPGFAFRWRASGPPPGLPRERGRRFAAAVIRPSGGRNDWTASCPKRLQHINPAHADHDIA